MKICECECHRKDGEVKHLKECCDWKGAKYINEDGTFDIEVLVKASGYIFRNPTVIKVREKSLKDNSPWVSYYSLEESFVSPKLGFTKEEIEEYELPKKMEDAIKDGGFHSFFLYDRQGYNSGQESIIPKEDFHILTRKLDSLGYGWFIRSSTFVSLDVVQLEK